MDGDGGLDIYVNRRDSLKTLRFAFAATHRRQSSVEMRSNQTAVFLTRSRDSILKKNDKIMSIAASTPFASCCDALIAVQLGRTAIVHITTGKQASHEFGVCNAVA